MTTAQIQALLELIDEIVRWNKSWREKKDAVIEEAADEQMTSLIEFCAWFEG